MRKFSHGDFGRLLKFMLRIDDDPNVMTAKLETGNAQAFVALDALMRIRLKPEGAKASSHFGLVADACWQDELARCKALKDSEDGKSYAPPAPTHAKQPSSALHSSVRKPAICTEVHKLLEAQPMHYGWSGGWIV